jgi:hypothetical protein
MLSPRRRNGRFTGRAIPFLPPFFLSCFVSLVAPLMAGATQLLRVYTPSKSEFLRLQTLASEPRDCGAVIRDEYVEFPAVAGRSDELTGRGFRVDVIESDLESFYAARLGQGKLYGGYHTYVQAIRDMDALVAAYPDIMMPKMSIGRTLEGRDLWVYKISKNPNIEESEPEVFFNSYTHAREVIGFEVVYDLARTLTHGYGTDPRITRLVDTRAIWIEPVVNPDGVEYNAVTSPGGGGLWRKNRRPNEDGSYGVDINRNFNFRWGLDDVGSSPASTSEDYRGRQPFSEPESQAMREFIHRHRFSIAVNYHSYSGLRLFSWGFADFHTPDYSEMLALLESPPYATYYPAGTSWELLYFTNGDMDDWMYGEQTEKPKILAFTPEVGSGKDGFWPNPTKIASLAAENREINLRMIELADNPYRILPPNVAVVDAPDTVRRSFTLTWSSPEPDPDNPPTRWSLMETTGHVTGVDKLEGGNVDRWRSEGWRWTATRSHSATHSFYSGQVSARNNILLSLRGHLVQSGEQLKFWTWYEIEKHLDFGYVEVSTNARDFSPLAGNITTEDDAARHNIGNGITGRSDGWVQAVFNLSGFAGRVIWLRFRYNTDASETQEGWYVDDIEPADLFTSESMVADSLPTARYRFTNHHEGPFSFLVRALDAEGDSAIWGPPRTLLVHGPADSQPEPPDNASWAGLRLAGANPFFEAAHLRFVVPVSAEAGDPITLRVFDLSGRMVADLRWEVDRSIHPPGTTVDTEWNPQGLPSGLYFARLQAGKLSSEQRLLYLRRNQGTTE